MNDTLKIVTCGSVDDGKSTLIGHMLYDSKLIFADQKRALELDSKVNSANGEIDYSLLLDGLMAEREQKITIDVAYRYFTTKKRHFIIADTPGHLQYTRNMAVGASFADIAIILVDASEGVEEQTRRHFKICSMFGIKDFIFTINKMDLIDYSKSKFDSIKKELNKLCENHIIDSVLVIPVSATKGDNITKNSDKLKWYNGEPLLSYLEHIQIKKQTKNNGFCLPIQRVSRPNSNFRGFQGEIISGEIKLHDEVVILPTEETAYISSILVAGKQADKAICGDPVTVCLDKEIDVSRGSVIVKDYNLFNTNKFVATLLWMNESPLKEGQIFTLQLGTQKLPAIVDKIKCEVDNDTDNHIEVKALNKNAIGICEIVAGQNIIFDTFDATKELGSFILIDKACNATAACGIIQYPLGIEGAVTKQEFTVNKKMRESLNKHKSLTIWLSGLSCSGKSTIAEKLEKLLFLDGVHTMILDGDNMRLGLCKDLSFSEQDRCENIRRTAETAKLLNDSGVVVIVSLISPLNKDRAMAKSILGDSLFKIYVNTDLKVCESRDKKGNYKKARRGEIKNFTGVSAPFETPTDYDYIFNNNDNHIDEKVDNLFKEIKKYL